MFLTRNNKLLVGGAVELTAVAFHLSLILSFDSYPLPVKIVGIGAYSVGTLLVVVGLIEEGRARRLRAEQMVTPIR